jgi:hypothetical protein
MENQSAKRVSAIKPDTEVLGYPYRFNCYGGSAGERERDVANAISRCQVDPNGVFQTSVLVGFPGSDENFLSVRGRREGDLTKIRAMLLSKDFGYSEA